LAEKPTSLLCFSSERLTRLVLLIAIAYTFSTLKGKAIKSIGQQKYIGRERKIRQSLTRNSNRPTEPELLQARKRAVAFRDFWLGLYGDVWIIAKDFVADWVEELMRVNPNKLPFYQKGIKAMNIIQKAF
jgi:hypothetical protein